MAFESNCSSHRPANTSDAFNSKFGYLSVAVERNGPYSVMAEARRPGQRQPGQHRLPGGLQHEPGFPAYVRRFNQACSLPALPLSTATGMADNAEVVVRKTAATVNGTYYAVINPTLRDKTRVTVTFPASKVTDLLTQTTHAVNALRMDLYPGEVRTFLVP